MGASKANIEKLRESALSRLESVSSLQAWQEHYTCVLGKKGELTALLRTLGEHTPEERRELGAQLNVLKTELEGHFAQKKNALEQADIERMLQSQRLDLSLPGRTPFMGHEHPLSQVSRHILSIFSELGFDICFGPDIETDFFNFSALNIPDDHPARDMHDTFWMKDGHLLRTHTSPVQIRTMQTRKPPIRMVAPGAVYRCDNDMTHSPMFHQIEGLMVDQSIRFSDLKGILTLVLRRLFGEKTKVRFRPSFFPFTEPSVEVDIGWQKGGTSTWLEILGAGMVNPAVFAKLQNPTDYPPQTRGFAFGLGVERIAMLFYGIDHIRHFYRNDLKFLEQF